GNHGHTARARALSGSVCSLHSIADGSREVLPRRLVASGCRGGPRRAAQHALCGRRPDAMTFANLPAAWVLGGLAGLAALLFVLQQLRTRYRDVTVVTTMFWKQVVDEAPVRKLRERFRHPWAYALILLIAGLVW